MMRPFKHKLAGMLLLLLSGTVFAQATDLLAGGADNWQSFDASRWRFADGELHGSTAVFDGEKTDPRASAFLVSSETFSGNFLVSLDVTFDKGRYLGVYLDYDPETQTGIWIGTGHALPADAPANEVERGYIKTIDNGTWVVRATGQLDIEHGQRVKLGFSRRGEDYSLWHDGRLIATYHKAGGYPPGHIQFRLTNAAVRIHRIEVRRANKK